MKFGTFDVRKRAAYTGRNPRNGKAIDIPAKRIPRFRAGKGLKEVVATLNSNTIAASQN